MSRPSNRRCEIAATWLALFIIAVTSGGCGGNSAGLPNGAAPSGADLTLVDSNAKTVAAVLFEWVPAPPDAICAASGVFVCFVLVPAAPFTVNRGAVELPVWDRSWLGGDLYYSSTDCSGPPFLAASAGPLALPAAVGEPSDTLYISDGAPAQTRTFQSSQYGGRCSAYSSQLSSFSTKSVVQLDGLFKPPFSLRPSPAVVTLQ